MMELPLTGRISAVHWLLLLTMTPLLKSDCYILLDLRCDSWILTGLNYIGTTGLSSRCPGGSEENRRREIPFSQTAVRCFSQFLWSQ